MPANRAPNLVIPIIQGALRDAERHEAATVVFPLDEVQVEKPDARRPGRLRFQRLTR